MANLKDNMGNETEVEAIIPSVPQFASEEMLDALDDAPAIGPSLDPQYYDFQTEGESLRGYYLGIGSIKGKRNGVEEVYPAALFQAKPGTYLQAGANLLSQVGLLRPGTPVVITYTGKKKTGSGNELKKFDVRVLNAPSIDVTHLALSAPASASAPALTGTHVPAPDADVAFMPESDEADVEAITIEDVHGTWATDTAAEFWKMDKQAAARRVWRSGLDGLMSRVEFIDWLAHNP